MKLTPLSFTVQLARQNLQVNNITRTMSGLAYDVPGSDSGPSSAGGLSTDFHTVRGDFYPHWTPGNPAHDAVGPADDFYPPPRMSPQLG